jgi:hypothetical protein
MSDDDLIRRGDAVAMLLAMRGPVDVPRTEKATWLDEGIDRCVQELRDFPADDRVVKLVDAAKAALKWLDDDLGVSSEAQPERQNLRSALSALEAGE